MRTFDCANAPNPRRSTASREPFVELNRCWICMPVCCDRMSGKFCAGERSISCELMMLVEVPTMPLFSRVQLTSICGKTICALLDAANVTSASAAPASLAICPFPMTHVPSVTFAYANASGEDEARREGRTGPQSGCGPVCGMSWETLLSRPSHRHCRHRCERPLRMDAPSTGWVTVLAGLLARGSPPFLVRPSQFPSGRVGP
jgi:hypothetical protein